MKRAWLLSFAILFLAFTSPGVQACERVSLHTACAAETLERTESPNADLPALLPLNPIALPEEDTRIKEPAQTPRAKQHEHSPLQYKEVRTRGVPYHGESPPPYLLPSVSS